MDHEAFLKRFEELLHIQRQMLERMETVAMNFPKVEKFEEVAGSLNAVARMAEEASNNIEYAVRRIPQ